MSSLLHLFAAFAYVINRFISISTLPTFAILLRLIYLCFNTVYLFFTPVQTDGFSQKFEWQMLMFPGLLSDLNKDWSLISSFPTLYSLAFGDCSKGSNYDFHVSWYFYLSNKVQVFVDHFAFSYFHSLAWLNRKIHAITSSCKLTLDIVFWTRYYTIFLFFYFFIFFYFLPFRVFHISVSWLFFPGDWVIASLLKSPGFFSVFRPFSIM